MYNCILKLQGKCFLGGGFNSNAYTTFQKFGVCKIFHMVLWSLLKCPYYAFSNITFHAVCHVAVCEQTFCKVMKLKKSASQLPKRGRQEFKSYSVKAVRCRPITKACVVWPITAVRAHGKEGFRETDSLNCFARVVRNHLEIKLLYINIGTLSLYHFFE